MGATVFPNGIKGKNGALSILDDINLASGKVIKINGVALIDTNTALGTSDTAVPSQKAVKTYADTKVSKIGTPVTNNLTKQTATGEIADAGVAVNDTGTGSAVIWTAAKIQAVVDAITQGQGSKLATPVQDIAALKAINTTNTTTWPDKIMILVENIGLYRLDQNDSATAGDDNRVVVPTVGTGRWFKMSSNISDHDNMSNIKKSSTNATTEYYHVKSATVESIEAATAQLDALKTTGTPVFVGVVTDTISEKTAGAGVTVGGVKLKNGIINGFTFTAASGNNQTVKTVAGATSVKFTFHVKDATGAVTVEILATKLDQATTTGDFSAMETSVVGTMTTYTDYGVTFTATDITLVLNTTGAGAVVTGVYEKIK